MRSRGIGLLGWAAAAALALIFTGCSPQSDQSTNSAPQVASEAAKSDALKTSAGAGVKALEEPRSEAPLHYAARQPGAERSVTQQASLTVEVESLEKAEKAMKQAVTASGGYVDAEQGENLAGERPVVRVTIQVPQKSFEDVLGALQALGRRTEMSMSASDVTEQILDYEAMIQQAQAQHEATIKKGGQFSYDPYKDRIRVLQQQKDELSQRAKMATITATLQQKPDAGLATAANVNWGSDTWNAAMSSAMGAFRFFGAIAIWLLAYSPIWGILLIGSIWVYRTWKRSASPVAG